MNHMKWDVYVTACEREPATLPRTLWSLEQAGWPEVRPIVDITRQGSRNTFLRACEDCWRRPGGMWRRAMIVQDDVLFCPGLRAWLEGELRGNIDLQGVVSLWMPEIQAQTADERGVTGWWRLTDSDLPRRAYGALAYVLDARAIEAIVRVGNYNGKPNQTDWYVGKVCKEKRIPYWHYNRSLCQHAGHQSSISDLHRDHSEYRRARSDWLLVPGYKQN